MKTVAVVTATTGRDTLRQTMDSVAKQSHPCTHYVFWDGPVARPEWIESLGAHHVFLPVPTGANGMMNGGIVAASAYLVQEDYLCWLDDDNWFEPDHIETMMEAVEGKRYAYSLRKLINADGSFFDYDDCESLGHCGELIDVNCYLMDRLLATQLAPAWYKTTGAQMVGDRHAFAVLKANNVPYGATGRYTVNYRLNPKRDLRPFFFHGNIINRSRYPDGLPWAK